MALPLIFQPHALMFFLVYRANCIEGIGISHKTCVRILLNVCSR